MYDIILGRSEKDRAEFGTKGTVFLGKQYVHMGNVTSLSNNVYMDVASSHVVFVVGKRGSGKCLHGDTLVRLEDGSNIAIKDLRNVHKKVISLNKESKLVPAYRKGFYEREVSKLLYIKLASGKDIKLTPEHPLLTKRGWLPAETIGVGGKIAALNKNSGSESASGQVQILLAESDIFWDEIVEVKELTGRFKVYDILVPGTHNFVANDIIVHNSYTMGVISEGISDLPPEIAENIAVVMLDTMGIYWTMKFPNKQDDELLSRWGLKGKGLDVKIFTPKGYYKSYKDKGIPTDAPFAIKPSELSVNDWLRTFQIEPYDDLGVLITMVISDLQEKGLDYSVQDIIESIKKEERAEQKTKYAAQNLFTSAESWGLFDKEGTPLNDVVNPGRVSVIDVSVYASMAGSGGVRALVIGLISHKLFLKRMMARKNEEFKAVYNTVKYMSDDGSKKQTPIVWLVIDECHEFLPRRGKTAASDALITILREGRQPGISLILASQQPGKIHTDVMTQSDIVIGHRITAKIDTEALGALMQSYMRESIDVQLNKLPREKGSALVFDDTNERLYPIKIRPRFTWHGGSSPSLLQKRKEIYEI